MSNIRSFKLISGEEMVANLISTEEQNDKVVAFIIESPHVMQFQHMNGGQLGLALVPWTLSNMELREKIRIPAQHVIADFETAHKVQQQFIQQTSSIALPTTPGIIK
jgi:flagellar assembly factor FliW